MPNKPMLKRFTAEEQQHNERLARLEYGPDTVNESVQRWKSYTEDQREAILEEGDAIYADMAQALEDGLAPNDDRVSLILARWHEHIRHFYEPTLEILQGLGYTYANNPEFRANFTRIHADLPDYLHEAIDMYVDELETEALETMMAEDDARVNRLS